VCSPEPWPARSFYREDREETVASLGSFGAAVKELDPDGERDTFDFFGETFTVEGVIPPMLMLQLGAASSGKIEESEGLAAIWEALRCCLTLPERDGKDPDAAQFDRFYKLAVARREDLEDLIRVAMALFEAQSGKATERLSTSPGGPLPTSTSSNGSSAVPPDLRDFRPADVVSAG
jgi:hypothetical protein